MKWKASKGPCTGWHLAGAHRGVGLSKGCPLASQRAGLCPPASERVGPKPPGLREGGPRSWTGEWCLSPRIGTFVSPPPSPRLSSPPSYQDVTVGSKVMTILPLQSITTSQHAHWAFVHHHPSPCLSHGHPFTAAPVIISHQHAKPSRMTASPHVPARQPPSAPAGQHLVRDIQPGHRRRSGPAVFTSAPVPPAVPDSAASRSAQAVGCSSEPPGNPKKFSRLPGHFPHC